MTSPQVSTATDSSPAHRIASLYLAQMVIGLLSSATACVGAFIMLLPHAAANAPPYVIHLVVAIVFTLNWLLTCILGIAHQCSPKMRLSAQFTFYWHVVSLIITVVALISTVPPVLAVASSIFAFCHGVCGGLYAICFALVIGLLFMISLALAQGYTAEIARKGRNSQVSTEQFAALTEV
jgi:uncharacterized membrane protein